MTIRSNISTAALTVGLGVCLIAFQGCQFPGSSSTPSASPSPFLGTPTATVSPQSVASKVKPMEGVADLVVLGEPIEETTRRLGEPAETRETSVSALLMYPDRGFFVEESDGKVAAFWTDSDKFSTETGIKVGDSLTRAFEGVDVPGSAGLYLNGLPDLNGVSDPRLKIDYYTTSAFDELSERGTRDVSIDYICWNAGNDEDKKAMKLFFPPLPKPDQSVKPTVVTVKGGVPKKVVGGDSWEAVRARMGEPEGEDPAGEIHLYTKLGLMLETVDGTVKKILTNDPRYAAESGLRVGDPMSKAETTKNSSSFSSRPGRGGMPSVTGLPDGTFSGVVYYTTGTDNSTAKIEYIQWGMPPVPEP